jgi:hypothetical protein
MPPEVEAALARQLSPGLQPSGRSSQPVSHPATPQTTVSSSSPPPPRQHVSFAEPALSLSPASQRAASPRRRSHPRSPTESCRDSGSAAVASPAWRRATLRHAVANLRRWRLRAALQRWCAECGSWLISPQFRAEIERLAATRNPGLMQERRRDPAYAWLFDEHAPAGQLFLRLIRMPHVITSSSVGRRRRSHTAAAAAPATMSLQELAALLEQTADGRRELGGWSSTSASKQTEWLCDALVLFMQAQTDRSPDYYEFLTWLTNTATRRKVAKELFAEDPTLISVEGFIAGFADGESTDGIALDRTLSARRVEQLLKGLGASPDQRRGSDVLQLVLEGGGGGGGGTLSVAFVADPMAPIVRAHLLVCCVRARARAHARGGRWQQLVAPPAHGLTSRRGGRAPTGGGGSPLRSTGAERPRRLAAGGALGVTRSGEVIDRLHRGTRVYSR